MAAREMGVKFWRFWAPSGPPIAAKLGRGPGRGSMGTRAKARGKRAEKSPQKSHFSAVKKWSKNGRKVGFGRKIGF